MSVIGSLIGALGGIGGVMAINKIVDYFVPIKYQPQFKAQKERDDRLQEFQKRQQKENQLFQAERDAQQQAFQGQRDAEQRHFQMEMEANRMAFQERIEMRRLQVQKQLEEQRAKLTIALNEMNIKNSREIARFNAMAMRETQILVARENAQNLLQDHMVQDALKNFPLNISPLVLLKNRPHSLASLLRFTVGDNCNIVDVASDVMNYAENPEALNVFVAPVYVDSKIKNREILSKQIWDTTYQRLESFFTTHYNRRSKRPVIFYPTAWNDKYSPGMHASETLHFFLRDMPCVVLEPRFDGNNFRIMVSSWGLGYTSTEHIRTELNFNINIDAILAYSVYERSKSALGVLNDLTNADIAETEKTPFFMQQRILERNIKLYESLRIDERIGKNQMNEIDAFGIYNIFKIEPLQDLTLLSDALSAQIGMTLASLTDIHHLRSTDTDPIFPELMKTHFPQLYSNRELRKLLYKSYERIFIHLRSEESYILSPDERKLLVNIRETQISKVRRDLELQSGENSKEEIEQQIRKYCRETFGFENSDFRDVWEACLDEMSVKDKPFFELLLPQINNEKMQRQLKRVLDGLC
ncbi:MAG: hypothetical protein E7088_04645 [Bacteroidales bacterium]|nr:hypothetical protein [Bacteroidales bacterium]